VRGALTGAVLAFQRSVTGSSVGKYNVLTMNEVVQTFDVLMTYAIAASESQFVGRTNKPSLSHDFVPVRRHGLTNMWNRVLSLYIISPWIMGRLSEPIMICPSFYGIPTPSVKNGGAPQWTSVRSIDANFDTFNDSVCPNAKYQGFHFTYRGILFHCLRPHVATGMRELEVILSPSQYIKYP
jgi:hypothetical protein